uniref:NADH-ubiquinone oxidoreductase chain 1 n=1 Tax=Lepidonotopodium sp. YZ-2018 TaxID=2153333 RepID=A0A343W681_9ANNE|nr:NADH dehydrogenase subunit 1 [Lepidonotopodium sp. YZ-2018]
MPYLPILNITLTLVMALLSMAFFTLLERKILGYTQLRKGPNKVVFMGIPQPMADALKLLAKEQTKPSLSNFFPLIISPFTALALALMMWFLYPTLFPTHFFVYATLFMLSVSSLNVYTILVAGWASNSKYALMGSLRGIAQTISYEVSMALILLSSLILLLSFDFSHILSTKTSWIIFMSLPTFLIWSATILAETNRTPFDLSEGESELVSGFNTEFSGGPFALIFMAEYTNILFMSILTAVIFSGGIFFSLPNQILFFSKILLMATLFIWVRSAYPRLRYDRLMNICWKTFLPWTLASLTLCTTFSFAL